MRRQGSARPAAAGSPVAKACATIRPGRNRRRHYSTAACLVAALRSGRKQTCSTYDRMSSTARA
jgi:hypothetical protein